MERGDGPHRRDLLLRLPRLPDRGRPADRACGRAPRTPARGGPGAREPRGSSARCAQLPPDRPRVHGRSTDARRAAPCRDRCRLARQQPYLERRREGHRRHDREPRRGQDRARRSRPERERRPAAGLARRGRPADRDPRLQRHRRLRDGPVGGLGPATAPRRAGGHPGRPAGRCGRRRRGPALGPRVHRRCLPDRAPAGRLARVSRGRHRPRQPLALGRPRPADPRAPRGVLAGRLRVRPPARCPDAAGHRGRGDIRRSPARAGRPAAHADRRSLAAEPAGSVRRRTVPC